LIQTYEDMTYDCPGPELLVLLEEVDAIFCDIGGEVPSACEEGLAFGCDIDDRSTDETGEIPVSDVLPTSEVMGGVVVAPDTKDARELADLVRANVVGVEISDIEDTEMVAVDNIELVARYADVKETDSVQNDVIETWIIWSKTYQFVIVTTLRQIEDIAVGGGRMDVVRERS
jgi:hypothetical protein